MPLNYLFTANTMTAPQNFTCPNCQTKVTARLVTAVYPSDKHLANLLKGTLNRCRCAKCETEFRIDTPMTFTDREKGVIIYLHEPPEDGYTEEIEQEIDCQATEMFSQQNLPRPTIRVTFNHADFVEKICLHILGFDDRLIEFAKYQLLKNMPGDKLSVFQHKLLLDFSNTDNNKLIFLVFDRESKSPLTQVHIPFQDFQALTEEFADNPQMWQELETVFPNCYVSVDRIL